MKNYSVSFTGLCLLLSLPFTTMAAIMATEITADEAYLQECKQYAIEDGVSSTELELYLQECIDGIKADEANQNQDQTRNKIDY